jgi:hypothetical protein
MIDLGSGGGPTRRSQWLSQRPWLVALSAVVVLGAAAGVALVRQDGSVTVVATQDLLPTSTTVGLPTTLPAVTTVSTTTSTVAPYVPPPARVTTTIARAPGGAPRPACVGEKSGYGGYGCTVSATEGRLSVRFEAYGQILQVGRDQVQLNVTAEDSQGGGEVSLRFSHGDGTEADRSVPYRCGSNEPVHILHGGSYVYPATGSYTVTAAITTGLCDQDTGQMRDPQTVTLSVPVLVCQRIDVVDDDVRCTTA